MAGVAIERTGQWFRDDVRNLLRLKPGGDCGLDLLIALPAFRVQQVLVEGTHQDEHAVSPSLENLNYVLECVPLKRRIRIDPGIILARNAILVPGLRQVAAGRPRVSGSRGLS